MSDDELLNLINNAKSMIDSGNIPDNIKDVLSKLSNTTNTVNSNDSSSSFINNQPVNTNTNSSKGLNIDMETLLKMKNVMNSINKSDDPRANLLHSLKPYLRKTRKDKIDQYVNLLNISKIAEILNNENKENNGNV